MTFRLPIFAMLMTAACILQTGCAASPGSRDSALAPSTNQTARGVAAALPSRTQARVENPKELLGVNSLVIAPVEYSDRTRSTPIDGIDAQLEAAARRELDLKLFDRSTFGSALPAYLPRDRAIEWARRVGADAILITELQNYIERAGSAVGGDPGSVNFQMSVVRVSNLREVWSVNYNFRDKALSDNLFKLGEKFGREEGPGWQRPQQMLFEGFSEALRDLASRRLSQFQAG